MLSPQIRQLVGGARLDSLDWWAIERPGWMLGSGWSLTPEVGGMTDQDRTGPHLRPAEAFLRRGSAPMRVLIGGRDLAPQADPGVVSIEIDGQPLDQLQVSRDLPRFVRWIDLPAGLPAGSTPYARLSVRVLPVLPGQPAPPVGLEQFDAAPAGVPMYAFADGWHELEEDPATGRLWRWTVGQERARAQGLAPGDDPRHRRGVAAPVLRSPADNRRAHRGSRESAASRPPRTSSRPSPSPATPSRPRAAG